MIDHVEYKALASRCISQATCQHYGYGVADGKHVATYRNASGRPVAQHLRGANKAFSWVGSASGLQLYGQHLWPAGGEALVITEGELDALSVAEVFGCRRPVVSLPNGAAGARKAITENLEYVDSFGSVILAFDDDEPGRVATEQVLDLLSPGKGKTVSWPDGCKDASDVLTKRDGKALIQAVCRASVYRPDGIVSAKELWEDIQRPPQMGLSYPWPAVTDMTLGIRPAEMVVLGAGTGMGKTDWFKEIALHLVVEHGRKVGILFLEEPNRDTALTMMAKHLQRPVHLPTCEVDPDVKRKAYEELFCSDQVFLYDHFGACDFETVRSRMRFMVLSCGCDVLFLDHLTALTDGETSDRAVNQKTRNIVSSLAQMTRELDFGLFAISHLRKADGTPHEEGGRVHLNDLYGASAIKQWANFAFGLERNQQAEDPEERCTSTLRCLKDRLRGLATGRTVDLRYDPETTRQTEVAVSEMF
jgi:twinkle protein